MNIGKHSYSTQVDNRCTTDDKVRILFAKKLKEASFSQSCFKESPRNTKKVMVRKITKRPKRNTKEKSDTCRSEEKGNKMGWPLRERRKKVKFSRSQLEFLLDVYNEEKDLEKRKIQQVL